jgi:hypothetical protein
MENPVRHRITRERKWSVWVGNGKDLTVLGQEVEKLFLERRTELIGESDTSSRGESSTGRGQYIRSLDEMRFEVTVKHGGDSIVGALEDVLEQFDKRMATAVHFEGIFGFRLHESEVIKVELDWHEKFTPAVTLEVVSGNHDWANKATANISELLDRRYQRWGVIHREPWRIIAGVAFNLVIYFLTVNLLDLFWQPSWSPWVRGGLGAVAGFSVSFVMFMHGKAFYWLFPKVEVAEGDQSSSGMRRIFFVLLTLLGFATSVYVEAIT